MLTYTSQENQTLLDIAVQLYGSVEYAIKLVVDNKLDINDDIYGGTTLFYDADLFTASAISDGFALNGVFVPTQGPLLTASSAPANLIEHSDEEYSAEEYN